MQNLVNLRFTPEQLILLDEAIAVIRRNSGGFIALHTDQRRELPKMGDKSEAFVRETMDVLTSNPQIVPESLGLAEAQADLAALDALRPRLRQLRQLVELAEDTEMALGSDLMSVALEGYALLKVSGKGEALKGAQRALSARFKSTRREAPALVE